MKKACVAHTKDRSFLTTLFSASRGGGENAALAIAHRILVIAYHILGGGVCAGRNAEVRRPVKARRNAAYTLSGST